jgi:hypothetical protein
VSGVFDDAPVENVTLPIVFSLSDTLAFTVHKPAPVCRICTSKSNGKIRP